MKHLWAILTIVVCSPFIIAQETIAVVDFDGKGAGIGYTQQKKTK
jgi:hypothetical protein